ncbi:MAG: acetate kinase [Lachnospiraceae bacterium]|nr:acetate kinase [Lachnospiraceae bacterium]
MKILVINCGSSSLKYQLIDSESEKVLAKGLCERIGIDGRLTHTPSGKDSVVLNDPLPDHEKAVSLVIEQLTDSENGVIASLDEIGAVGHRIVHGGERFASSCIITDEVIEAISECSDLAPLHNPANLIGINACRRFMPEVPMVAVFDTAFHQTMPDYAYLYGIPYEYYENYKLRKYGFHGTSHSFVSKRCAEIMGKPYKDLNIIVCHLGNGSSITAVKNGESVDTSMGLTPLDGFLMGTRSGSVDPTIISYIAKKEDKTIDEVMDILNKKSGVLGISGVSSDFRDLQKGMEEGNERCKKAIEMFAYRVAGYIGSYVVAMGGADAICFTAGIGENTSIVRELVLDRLKALGVTWDSEANKKRGEEVKLSKDDSKIDVYIIPTNEELAIARETVALVK